MLGASLGTLALITALLCTGDRRRGRWRWAFFLAPLLFFISAILAGPSGFAIGKALGRLMMPAGLLWVLLFVGLWSALDRGVGRWAAWFGIAFLLHTVAGNDLLASWALNQLEGPYRAAPAVDLQLDAIYVLGGGSGRAPWGDAVVSASGGRVIWAARLYRRGVTRRLVSGGVVKGDRGQVVRDLGAEVVEIWRELGVPQAATQTLPGPRNTSEEMVALRQRARREGWTQVGLVTSAWHMRRAMALGRAQGLALVPLAVDFRGAGTIGWHLAALCPSGHGYMRLKLAVWETLGAALGR